MELEDSEVFEITDYTNVTNWEIFISKLEDILSNLENSQIADSLYRSVHTINFEKYELLIGLINPNVKCVNSNTTLDESNNFDIAEVLVLREEKVIQTEFETEIDWQVTKWFGKRKYVAVIPSSRTSIFGEEQASQLVSSIMIAVTNVKCQLPVIVKYGARNWPLYHGVALDNDIRTSMRSVPLKYTPKQCNYLSGLRRIFQEKLGKGYVLDDDILLSSKYTYYIENSPHRNDVYFQGSISPLKKMHFFQYLPIGFLTDPVKCITLSAHWNQVQKIILSHTEYMSLPVSSADNWYLSVKNEISYDGVLYKTLRKLLKSFLVAQKSSEILTDGKRQDLDAHQINKPLIKLTKSSVGNRFSRSAIINQLGYPNILSDYSGDSRTPLIDDKAANEVLMYLFPDARQCQSDSNPKPYQINPEIRLPNYEKLRKRFSSANHQSLFHRMAVCLTILLNHQNNGLKIFSYIWTEIVMELRYRLEQGIPLPETRISNDYKLIENDDECDNKDEIFTRLLQETMPHLADNQVEQRIYLLNYCILSRLRYQYLQRCDNTPAAEPGVESDDFNEQFYDCESEPVNDSAAESKMDVEPRGRLRRCGDLMLMKHPDVPVYVPITQVLPVELSQNSKKEQQLEFSKNTFNASVIADMSAFKAANPGCVMEDFIRWFSPGDFVSHNDDVNNSSTNDGTDRVPGKLSNRMKFTENTWIKFWFSAAPVPARHQKRLFDDVKVAENVLLWLQNLTSAEISSSVINNVLIESLDAVVECIEPSDPPELCNQVEAVANSMLNFWNSIDPMDITGSELDYYQGFDELIGHFQRIECSLAVKRSLYLKFMPEQMSSASAKENLTHIINQLLVNNAEVVVSKGTMPNDTHHHLFDRILSMYITTCRMERNLEPNKNIDEILTEAYRKEYVFSLNCQYPFPTSRKFNQWMYVSLSEDEFRISTSLNEDITYF